MIDFAPVGGFEFAFDREFMRSGIIFDAGDHVEHVSLECGEVVHHDTLTFSMTGLTPQVPRGRQSAIEFFSDVILVSVLWTKLFIG